MRNPATPLLLAAGFSALAAGAAIAKSPPKEKITLDDARTCVGQLESSPKKQIAACTKVLNSGKVLPPYQGDYLAARGAAYNAAGAYEPALQDLNKALGLRKAPEYYFQRGMIHMAKGDVPAGKADFDEVIRLRPTYAAGYLMRGLAAFQVSDYQEALKYFDGALERVPTYYQALFARGVTKKRLGDNDGGDKDIKDARGMSAHVEKDLAPFGVTP